MQLVVKLLVVNTDFVRRMDVKMDKLNVLVQLLVVLCLVIAVLVIVVVLMTK